MRSRLFFTAGLLAALPAAAPAATIFTNDFSTGLTAYEAITGNFKVTKGYVGHAGGYPSFDYSTYRLQLDLTGVTDAYLDFDYDVSSEAYYDVLTVSANGLTLANYSGAEAGHARFGLGDSAGLTTLLFTFSADYLINYGGVHLDNVAISGTGGTSTSAAPEPATWLTMVAGFGLTGLALRSRRKPTIAFG